jgi:hypothetical protein
VCVHCTQHTVIINAASFLHLLLLRPGIFVSFPITSIYGTDFYVESECMTFNLWRWGVSRWRCFNSNNNKIIITPSVPFPILLFSDENARDLGCVYKHAFHTHFSRYYHDYLWLFYISSPSFSFWCHGCCCWLAEDVVRRFSFLCLGTIVMFVENEYMINER